MAGVIRLSNALAIIRERLSSLIKADGLHSGLEIPNHLNWTVTMWRYATDSSIEYKGKMFHTRREVAKNALIAAIARNGKMANAGT
jgi:hypothetical protein